MCIRDRTGPDGECLAQLDGELETVDCSIPHDLQRISSGVLDEPARTSGAPLDGDDLSAVAQTACRAAATALDDGSERGIGVSITLPSSVSWRNGDRRFECYIAAPDGRLVGDVLTSSGR